MQNWKQGGCLAGLLLTCIAAPLVVRAAPPVLTDADLPEHVPNRVLVMFRSGVSAAARRTFLGKTGCTLDTRVTSPHFVGIDIPPALVRDGATVTGAIAAFQRDPAVLYVEPDYISRITARPNDTRMGELWGLHNIGQTIQGQSGRADADIDAFEAWDVSTGDRAVRVAVIDTGVDYNHVDLTGNVLRNAQGALIGRDTQNDDNDPMDDDGHGTHVAGTVGAVGNNAEGVTGVCQQVSIMCIKAGGTNGFSGTDLFEAYDFAIANNADVINASLGALRGPSPIERTYMARIQSANILYVAAAGNDTNDNDARSHYPSNYSTEYSNVIAVAATDNVDRIAGFSNWGRTTVNIGAPGVSILSCQNGGGYQYLQGTSMAAPHVAGAAALVLATAPNLRANELRQRLEITGDNNLDMSTRTTSGKRLNVFNALRVLSLDTPDGGEVVQLGSDVLVQWQSKGFPTGHRIKIELSRNGGQTFTETLALATDDDGEFTWTSTGPLSDTCRIRITSSIDVTQTDTSASDFRIVDGALFLDAPNGGEVFLYGQSVDIEWTATDFAGPTDNPTVRIDLSRDAGTTWTTLFANTPNDGMQTWTAIGPATPDALIRVTAVSHPEFEDESDDVFEIREPPAVTLAHPNGGEAFVEGRTTTIQWDTVGIVGDLRIELSRNGGVNYETLFPSVPNTGEVDWVVTGPTTRMGRIRITARDDSAVTDHSNGVFSVVAASLRVTAPIRDKSALVGQRETIRWTSTGLGVNDDIVIEYSGDGGETWDELAGGVANTGSFEWTIDQDPSENALVRVSSLDYPEVSSISSRFSVREPTLFLTSPNGGDVWNIGSQAIVRWSGTTVGQGTVDILLSRDGGRSFPFLLKGNTPNDGGESIGVSGATSNKVRVRVVWRPAVRVFPDVEDRSDRNFRIAPARRARR